MLKILKLLKAAITAGVASVEAKAEIEAEFKKLSADEQAAVQEDVEKVKGLPTSNGQDDDVKEGLKKLLAAATAEVSTKMEAQLAEMKSKFDAWIAEQKALMEQKSGVYHPDVKIKRQKINEYMKSFVVALYQGDSAAMAKLNGFASTKELTTDATGSPYGGYVVDAELSAEIRHLITEYGVARREFSAVQLQKNSYKANHLATDVSVSWVDEGSAIPSKQAVLDQEELELKKLGAIVTLTSELLQDQEVDLFAFLGGRVAEKLAQAEDEAFFKGDGTSTYGSFTGLLLASDVNEVNMSLDDFSELTADDLLDMQDSTPAGAHANGKYYMHRTILSVVRKLKDDQGQYIFQNPGQGLPATIWNKPVVLVEAMPAIGDSAPETSFVLFGDLKQACIFGFKGAITVKRFDSGVVRNVAGNADINLITTDREAVRWTERVGYIRIIPTAVTKLTTGTAS